MNDPTDSGPAGEKRSVAVHVMLFFLALLVVFPVYGWFGYRSHGADGLLAAVVAGVVCWVAGTAALLLVGVTRGTPAAIHASLLGMLFRMGLPLLVGIVLQRTGGPLARAGVFGMILCYYFWMLIVETLLSVRLIGASKTTVAKA